MSLKRSNYSYVEGFFGMPRGKKSSTHKALDFDKAAKIIKKSYAEHKDLIVEAGLQEDWEYTSGVIFKDGHPTIEDQTYLSSNWAIPTLILEYDDKEQKEIECYCDQNERFGCHSKWDDVSLKILGINIKG